MYAMVLNRTGERLVREERPDPTPGPGEVVIKVTACGVCRTDLHVVDGELPQTRLPVVPGHEIVGRVERLGAGVTHLQPGERVGVGWLGHACGTCPYCAAAEENLCDAPDFTGCTRDGGFASHAVADAGGQGRQKQQRGETEGFHCAASSVWLSQVVTEALRSRTDFAAAMTSSGVMDCRMSGQSCTSCSVRPTASDSP